MNPLRTVPRHRPGRAARFETLERRALFAGTALYLTEATTPAGLELSIDGSPGDDRISVVAYGDTLSLANKGGWSTTVPNHYALIRVNAARGNDVVIVDGSVAADAVLHGSNGDDTIMGGAGDDRIYGGFGRDRILGGAGDDTIVTIGDSVQDRVSGDDGFDRFWTDSAKSEVITDGSAEELAGGVVNRVSTFLVPRIAVDSSGAAADPAAAASRDLAGQDLPDPRPVVPSQMTYRDFSGRPLFTDDGPKPTDVDQGLIGDCYLLASVASVAHRDANLIRRSIVELGDGTYGVRFERNGAAQYVRADNDLATWKTSTDPVYAALGPGDAMWVAVMEKAYTIFRTGEGTYESINRGLPSEGYEALGLRSDLLRRGTTALTDVMASVKAAFDTGAAMTWATYDVPVGVPLASDHGYAIADVELDAGGRPVALRLLNPWGFDGGGNVDEADDGYVTITAEQAMRAFVGVYYAEL